MVVKTDEAPVRLDAAAYMRPSSSKNISLVRRRVLLLALAALAVCGPALAEPLAAPDCGPADAEALDLGLGDAISDSSVQPPAPASRRSQLE